MNDKTICEIMQKKELEMLIKLKEILEKHNIPFALAYGTTLGCIRHKGFIPWDDDVDIHIKGEDYQKLKKVFENEDTGNLELQDPFLTKGYPYPFPKIVAKDTVLVERSLNHLPYKGGVYIDVFPLFGVKKSERIKYEYKKRYIRYCILRAKYKYKYGIFHCLSLLFNEKEINKRLYKSYSVPYFNSQFCADPSIFSTQLHLKSEWVEEITYFDFCGEQMPIFKRYDEYLTHLYGKYMELPKVEDRVSNHDISYLEINGVKYID